MTDLTKEGKGVEEKLGLIPPHLLLFQERKRGGPLLFGATKSAWADTSSTLRPYYPSMPPHALLILSPNSPTYSWYLLHPVGPYPTQ